MTFYNLAGDDPVPQDTCISFSTYLSGSWQTKTEKQLAYHFGFRSLLVKINNQLNFNLFHKVNAKGVIAGKGEYLFETTYINSYLGKDFMGVDSIRWNLNRLKIISDQLLNLNKVLIVVIAPGKPSFYKEYLPGNVVQENPTNYDVISRELKKRNIHAIDFSSWFNSIKKTSQYPLYPKHGNHWSTYGAYLAADSLIRYIEFVKKTDLPELVVKSMSVEQPKNEDKDIEYGINLLFKLKSFDLAYPKIKVDTIGKVKPKLLVIGDSFYWNLYHLGFTDCFNDPSFWYYNKAVYPQNSAKPTMTDNLKKREELNKQDVIIILATESNIKSFGWGFLDDAEKVLN